MNQNAEETEREAMMFLQEKKDKAKKVMVENWDQQLNTKANEEIVGRIFD